MNSPSPEFDPLALRSQFEAVESALAQKRRRLFMLRQQMAEECALGAAKCGVHSGSRRLPTLFAPSLQNGAALLRRPDGYAEQPPEKIWALVRRRRAMLEIEVRELAERYFHLFCQLHQQETWAE